jgi:hypothetical protein
MQKDATRSRGLRVSGIQDAVRSAGDAHQRASLEGKKRPQSLNSAEDAGERDEVLRSIGAPQDSRTKRLRPVVRAIQRD